MAHIIRTKYVQGADEHAVLVFRREGERVRLAGTWTTYPALRGYVVQYGADTLFDSGYSRGFFKSLRDAEKALEEYGSAR